VSTPSAFGGLTFGGDAATATLSAALADGASAAVSTWLASASVPTAVSDELAARIAEVGGVLSAASEAVLVDRFDAGRGVHQAYSVLHDGRIAVIAGGGPEKSIVSAPQGLEEVVAQLSTEIGGRIDAGPPRTARIGGPALFALRAAVDPRLDHGLDAVEERLAALIDTLEVQAEPEAILAALESDELLSRDDESVTAGPALVGEPALGAAVDGSMLVVTRMSLSRSGEPVAYDVRRLEFAGPSESRCLVLPPDEAGEIGFARLHVTETTALISSHLIGRAEPALVAARQAEAEEELPPPGFAAELTAADLVGAAGDSGRGVAEDTGVARALLAPPATVVLRSADGNRDAAEGIAIWDSGIVGWSWALGAGHTLVEPRDSLGRLAEAMLAERVERQERGPLLLSGSIWTERGLEYAGAEIAVADSGFSVLRTEGMELPSEIEPGALVDALLSATGLSR
jgi:hypothetical protein